MKNSILVFSAIAVTLLCGCMATEDISSTSAGEMTASISATSSREELGDDTEHVIVESDFPAYADLDTLADDSVLVVVGQYIEGEPEIVNTAKDADNPSVESDEVYAECHIFDFNIQEIIKGECEDSTIRVGLSYGIRPAGFTDLAVKDTYLEPTFTDYKVLFLVYSDADGFYYPTSQPYQLHTDQGMSRTASNESGSFVIDSAIDGLDVSFSKGYSLREIKEMCKQDNY